MKTLKHKYKKIKVGITSALFVLGLVATSVQAGKITSVPSATGAEGFGGWNLNNVEVIVNGTQGDIGDITEPSTSWFNPIDGSYSFAADSDLTYFSDVYDNPVLSGTPMGIVLAKDWPVGEPSGIKIINNDESVKFPKPQNC